MDANALIARRIFEDAVRDSTECRQSQDAPLSIGTRRGIRGHVRRGERTIGKAFQHARPQGSGPRVARFTATPSYPGTRLGDGPSIGTRFRTRADAVAALAAFDDAHGHMTDAPARMTAARQFPRPA